MNLDFFSTISACPPVVTIFINLFPAIYKKIFSIFNRCSYTINGNTTSNRPAGMINWMGAA
jgi:hypothetical protein